MGWFAVALMATLAVNFSLAVDIKLVSKDVTGPAPCAMICFGESQGTWKKSGHYLYIDSSLADCKFARQPLISATLVNTGDYSQYSGYVGIEQPGKFRYEMYAPGVSAEKANADNYQINWNAAGYSC
ncbi:hypothetical protein ACHWQZ_G000833 [Mnemiopsis leidyi]